MKKWIFAFCFLALTALVGSAYALFAEGPSQDRAAGAATALQPATASAAGEFKRCGGASGGCGSPGSGRSCCGGPAGSTERAEQYTEGIRNYLLQFYTANMGGDIDVEVRDFGCHHEAQILQAGKVIKRLSISGGVVSDIT